MTLTGDRKRQYQRDWMRDRRLGWILANGPCVDCGTWDRLRCVRIDHQPGDRKTATLWGLRASRRALELARCIVVCDSCHNKRLAERRRAQLALNAHRTNESRAQG